MTVFDAREAREALEIAEQATPGPWEVGEDAREQAATLRAQPVVATTGLPHGHPVDVIIPFGRAYSDARFVAHARTALPRAAARVVELELEVRKTQDDQDATERQRCNMRESRDEWQALAEKSIAEFYRLQALALEAVALGKERCESGLRCSYNKAESDPYRAALARFAELAKEVAQ